MAIEKKNQIPMTNSKMKAKLVKQQRIQIEGDETPCDPLSLWSAIVFFSMVMDKYIWHTFILTDI